MFYKKQKIGKKWYPRSFTAGTYDTKDVAERLSEMSTVSKGDTYAVLSGLGEVLGSMMEQGNSVKLDGLGTFYLVGNANGQGVDTPDEVGPEQFKKVVGMDELLRDKTPKPPMDSDLFISRSRKRIEDLTDEDCDDAECFEYCGRQVWNGF